MAASPEYVPALGRHCLTWLYDGALAALTRERRWRRDLVRLIDPKPGETIVDIGCGTGTLAIALKTLAPQSRICAVDPDPAALAIAKRKAEGCGAAIGWTEAMGDKVDGLIDLAGCDKIVSSLVFHQCTLSMKSNIAHQMWRLLKPGGQVFIADYGEQATLLMRMLFRQIQWLDGFERTEPNALGCIPIILADQDFFDIEEVGALKTPTGSISFYRAKR